MKKLIKTILIHPEYLLAGLLIFSSPLLFAEKDDHKAEQYEDSEHVESDHKNEQGHDKDGHADEDEHGHEKDDHDDDERNDVELSRAQIKQAGITTMRVEKRSVSKKIVALSEVKLNQYKTIKVSPTITTRVETRHVRLGDHVKKNDLLVTLHTISTTDISANVLATADLAASSADLAASIAEARGELAAATATWNRIHSLGKDAVSGKRYTEARIARQQAEARLKAYGEIQAQMKKLLESGNEPVQKHYELRAEQAGMIIQDDFVLGQIVTPEDVLFVISDMDHLWVEANIKPEDVTKIVKGSQVIIQVGDEALQGKVINIGRVLDEKTRTLPVRIEVETVDASLYPGQFVKTSINSKASHAAIIVPAEAVLRSSDGDWMLFVETAPGRFVPEEVEVVENLGDQLIIEGIENDTIIVSKGAFTLQSELAKSGFSVHNH